MHAIAMVVIATAFILAYLLVVGIDSMEYHHKTVSFDETYKIVQISDTQIRYMDEPCRNIESEWHCDAWNTTAFVHSLVSAEQPDLVIFTGDNVRGYTNSQAWNVLKNLLPNVSFALVTGNHDRETHSMSIPVMYRNIRQSFPSALLGNTQLLLTSGDTEYQLFMFDHAYTQSGWAPIQRHQIQWYTRHRRNMTTLMFNHIPLRQYENVSSVVGTWRNVIHYANKDSFWAHANNVLVFSAGHNHRNDFCGKYDASWLCYAGSAGYTTHGYTGWRRRARVFILNQTGVLTYKRLDDMSTVDTQFFLI
tara:strand:- start:5361 stop:6278 length:918 start_codon:yes stop_codon:yes gene_type:complete